MVQVLSASGSVRHGEMLAMKDAVFGGKNDLLSIQNSTDKTHIRSWHISPARSSAAPSRVVPMLHGDYHFPARVPFFHAPNSLSRVTQPVTLINDRCYFSRQD